MDTTDDCPVDVCRICTRLSNEVLNLFEVDYDGMVLAGILEHCLKRPISNADGLPKTICINCQANLITTYDFHSLCESSEQYLLKELAAKAFPQSDGTNAHQIDDDTAQIKCEIDYKFSVADVDDDTNFGYKTEPTLASELVCVEENFDENSIIEENPQPSQRVSWLRSRSEVSSAQRKSRQQCEDKVFECYECKKHFDHLRELRTHMNDHDSSRKPFECTICNMRFVHLNSWFRHRSRHTKNIHDCEYCDQAFNTLTTLKQHIQEMHKDKLNAYKCSQCTEKFALRFLLIWHNEWHKKAKQFVCSACDAVFFNERKLKAHFRDNHASHLCAECGKSFKTIHLLASHQMLHTSERPFGCDLCPSRFKWKAALKTHMLVHTGQKQHICDICGSSFTTKGSMKKHKRIHTGDRRYQCETCSMKFYSNDHLKRHKRTHTGERPYSCSYCPRSFSQSNDLTKHIRSHVGPNMYRCHCGVSFRLQTELRKHSYTHYNKDETTTMNAEQTQ